MVLGDHDAIALELSQVFEPGLEIPEVGYWKSTSILRNYWQWQQAIQPNLAPVFEDNRQRMHGDVKVPE